MRVFLDSDVRLLRALIGLTIWLLLQPQSVLAVSARAGERATPCAEKVPRRKEIAREAYEVACHSALKQIAVRRIRESIILPAREAATFI